MSKRKSNNAPLPSQKARKQPTTKEHPVGKEPTTNPLLKSRVNISFQVNLDFFEKIEVVKEESGFESTSELCREALRRLIRKEMWWNRYLNRKPSHVSS